jgi:hypothetical protein
LRTAEHTEQIVVSDAALSMSGKQSPPTQPGLSNKGILLESEDFRWRFVYTDGKLVEWEGTMSTVWMSHSGSEKYERAGLLKVERMEITVHDATVTRSTGSPAVDDGASASFDWGLPSAAIKMLEVRLSCLRRLKSDPRQLCEASEVFEPVRALADDDDLSYDSESSRRASKALADQAVALERLLSEYGGDELYMERTSDEDSDADEEDDVAFEDEQASAAAEQSQISARQEAGVTERDFVQGPNTLAEVAGSDEADADEADGEEVDERAELESEENDLFGSEQSDEKGDAARSSPSSGQTSGQ